MTRRERLEAKIERRQEWADGRRAKAQVLNARADPYRGDIAFNTQPGHIPERARIIRAQDKAHEHSEMAAHHEAKADGLADQLDRSVFSDDADAVEQLEARIAKHEAKRDRMKVVNILYRQGDTAGLAALGLDLDVLRARVAATAATVPWVKTPYETYELTNLGARIRADRERIKAIQARQARTREAERSSGGVVIEGTGDYVRVTFAEKPERAVLDALKAAGFTWHHGSWVGARATLPECVALPTEDQR